MCTMEGNQDESYYLCEGIWFDKTQIPYRLIDERNNNILLDINSLDIKILIFKREICGWSFKPIHLLLKDDKKHKDSYKPFKHSIYTLYGIFSYIEKIQRYKDGIPYESKDKDSTKILTFGFKRIFPEEPKNQFGNDKIEKILERTRHAMMHFGNIGDSVLLNNDYENDVPIKYVGTNKFLQKIEMNPRKMFLTILKDFKNYLEILKNPPSDEREKFERVFDSVYSSEIELLKNS